MKKVKRTSALWWLCPALSNIQPWEELCVTQDIQGESHVHVCSKVTLWGQCRGGRWLTVLSWWLIQCPDSSMTPYVYQKHCNNSLTQSNSLHPALRPSSHTTASCLIHRRHIRLSVPEGHTFSVPPISHALYNFLSDNILTQALQTTRHSLWPRTHYLQLNAVVFYISILFKALKHIYLICLWLLILVTYIFFVA